MEQELETSQASYEIQPRVFYEDFRNAVLYVQNVRGGTGASNWDRVFMADVSDPGNPIITTAAVGDRGQRFDTGIADAPARWLAARNRQRPATAVQHLHFLENGSAP